MSENAESTHVLTADCIINEIGRCEAGTMISEGDVLSSTWQWLLDRNFLRSVESIESEADADDEVSDTENAQDRQTEESTNVVEVEGQSAPTLSATDEKTPGRKTRKG